MRFVCVAQMFIFSLDYEMWSALLFLFCLICFVFDTQMFIFSLDYEMWSGEKINICVSNTKRIKQNKNNKTDHIS
jgi:hypothetical protein